MIGSQIGACISDLYDHFLARNCTRCERQLITAAADVSLLLAGNAGGCVAVSEVVVDGPGLLIGAHVSGAVITATLGGQVRVYGGAVLHAGHDRVTDRRFAGPGTRRLTAVPVSRGLS